MIRPSAANPSPPLCASRAIKPSAPPTAAEARELVAFCAARKVLLMDGFMWPHHPRTARLRKFLDGGGIGKVERVTGTFTFPLNPLDLSNIRLRSDLASAQSTGEKDQIIRRISA